MMVFTVIETIKEDGDKSITTKQTYEGFRRVWAHGQPAQVVASAFIEGEGIWWEIDADSIPLALDELARYYRAQYDMEVELVVYDKRQSSPVN